MSTNTRRSENFVEATLLIQRDDYEVMNNFQFNLYVDNKDIPAQIIDLCDPMLDIPREDWGGVDGASLWGFLRGFDVTRVFMTVTDPIFMVIVTVSTDGFEEFMYFKITYAEYHIFLHEFCNKIHEEECCLDWRIFGF